MVAGKDTIAAIQAIRQALEQLEFAESPKAYVFETEFGQLRAIVGSDSFKDVSLIKRQRIVWDHLRNTVPQEKLTNLYGVHPMDMEEYYSNVSET